MTITRRQALAAAPLLAAPAIARAQGFPARPLRLVVPFAGGGATDITARVVAEHMGRTLGQPVVIDNRAGAGGNIGTEIVAKAEPDGHTLLMATIGTASINQFLYRSLPFDPQRDFAAVSLVNIVANGVILHPSLPVRTMAELIELAKAKPGELNYGTPGNGTSGHMCGELLKTRAGISLTHVPFRGTSLVLTDLLAGRVQISIDNLPAYIPYIRDRKFRLIAVTSRERWFTDPEVPTVGETLPGFEAVAWFGVQAPSRTPAPVIAKLEAAVRDACADAAVKAKLRDIGSEVV
ncbi:MAG: tripartite tricarboxylate transporter substrate binding protein, partial [Acetobacteraceae bacterium]|nr:tripartite tricarboxylate transporter substrate binding protein [Acetobacteraceae bacterium]